jgi:hypothetical protein
MKLLSLKILGLAGIALVGACTPPSAPPLPNTPPPNNQPRMDDKPKMMMDASPSISPLGSTSSDAPAQLQVELYQLQVPFGSVSHNGQFWKRVDEQCVDVATYDLLFKNGVRVGEAPIAEWDYFRQVMEGHPAVTKSNSLVGAEGKPIEIPLRKEVRGEDIFYFDSHNQLQGRSFDASENLIAMTLQSAPRKADTLRIALCPIVRSMRKELQYSATNEQVGEISFVRPERLYEMNLRADVPTDSFLIVAPSDQSTWPTSIGNSFLVTDGTAERTETVLLVVPKPIHLVEAKSK